MEEGFEKNESEAIAGTSEFTNIKKTKSKRDIFRFASERPSAINLEHVTQINVEGKKITFQFYNTAMYIELGDDAAALSLFETVLMIWAGERE